MAESIARIKSKKFALRMIKLFKHLKEAKQEYILSAQILRSGTSIGANLSESRAAISKKDFINKIYIALKEADETLYWLELLNDSEYITNKQFKSLSDDCIEIIKILTSTTKTIVKGKESKL
ncbi:MAG: four helix bundle protein [Rickettsiales bacterium]|jgi:four helix bundle protein|nr:four helix bundle protein [Rickettsiales bacterium]